MHEQPYFDIGGNVDPEPAEPDRDRDLRAFVVYLVTAKGQSWETLDIADRQMLLAEWAIARHGPNAIADISEMFDAERDKLAETARERHAQYKDDLRAWQVGVT